MLLLLLLQVEFGGFLFIACQPVLTVKGLSAAEPCGGCGSGVGLRLFFLRLLCKRWMSDAATAASEWDDSQKTSPKDIIDCVCRSSD